MRTIKYELAGGQRDQVARAVFYDYRRLYGPLNVSDYLGGQPEPSVLEFWLLSLKLGVFYGSSRDKLASEFDAYRGQANEWQHIFAGVSPRVRDVIDRSAWLNFMLASQRGLADKTDEQRHQVIFRLLDAEHAADEHARAVIKPIAEEFAAGYEDADDKRAFKADLFGVEPPAADTEAKSLLTWVVNPTWAEIDWTPGDDPTPLIEAVIARHAQVYGNQPKLWQIAMGIGNNGGYLNSILGTAASQLVTGKASELAKHMAATFGFTARERATVERRLQELGDYLVRLGKPQLASDWKDYRSSFNGTIESWYSNRTSRQDEARMQIDTLTLALDELADLLRSSSTEQDAVSALCQELRGVLDDARAEGHVTVETSRNIRLLQGELRIALNEWQQRSGAPNKRLGRQGDLGKVFSKNIQSSSLFFGVSQRQRYEKLLRAKQLFNDQLDLLVDIWRSVTPTDTAVLVADRHVGALASCYARCTDPAVRKIYEQLAAKLQADFAKQQGRDRFYLGKYDKSKGFKQLPYHPEPVAAILRHVDMPALLTDVRANNLAAPDLLHDTVELSTTLLAVMLTAADDDLRYQVPDRGHLTERQQKLLDRAAKAGAHVDKATLSILQSYVSSELKGLAQLVQRRSVIERALVQSVNGGQVRLAYEVCERGGNRFRRYYVTHPMFSASENADPPGHPLIVADKTSNFSVKDFTKKEEPSGNFLEVRSSKYQIQFYEWLLGYLPRRKTKLHAGGAFTIAERNIELDWTGDVPKIADTGNLRLFVSQPFTIDPPDEPHTVPLEKTPHIMGVDIGEYGLAVSVIACDGNRVKTLYSGFLTDPQHQALVSLGTDGDRDNEVRSTFTSPSTHAARLRESLAGAYRNQLHALELQYHAWPAYDWEVSNYGRGAELVKVYELLKRSDLKRMDYQAANKQSWGQLKRDQHRWAVDASAAGTSQTCTRCKRWASMLVDEHKDYALQSHKVEGLATARLDDGSTVVCMTIAPKLKGGELKRAIYAVMRPPIDGIALKLSPKRVKIPLDDWKRQRGNNAIFICPFTDCHHVADADLQASLNIALRGYGKLSSEGKMAKAVDFLTFSQGLTYDPMSFVHDFHNVRTGASATTRK